MNSEMKSRCIDVYEIIKRQFKELQFKGLPNLSLKTISKVLFGDLYQNCKIKGGLEATTALWWSLSEKEKTKQDQYLTEVKEYNEIDCKVLWEMHNYIRNNH
jgi:predicted RecB family nuclease